ncbi:MAG: BspA family leucine-rich repeat surface protein, partial [Oscillospiraceae bacterium]|nr:BspA family leucine-rich repeat surface protein [Oscillospiraceae bacterium]
NMSYMFKGCSSLKSLDISSFSTNSVEYTNEYDVRAMANMFAGCEALEKISLGSSFSF